MTSPFVSSFFMLFETRFLLSESLVLKHKRTFGVAGYRVSELLVTAASSCARGQFPAHHQHSARTGRASSGTKTRRMLPGGGHNWLRAEKSSTGYLDHDITQQCLLCQ